MVKIDPDYQILNNPALLSTLYPLNLSEESFEEEDGDEEDE